MAEVLSASERVDDRCVCGIDRWLSADGNRTMRGSRIGVQDNIGQLGGINVYAYAKSNPANAVDPDGLSSIVFNRGAGTISLYRSDGSLVGTWPANNNVTNSANGNWPACDPCQYSHYNRHPNSGPNDAYGSHGIFVFNLDRAWVFTRAGRTARVPTSRRSAAFARRMMP